MKNFNDLRKELKEKDESLYFSLEIVGQLLAIRERKGVSQQELADLSGVTEETILKIEEGIILPDLDTVCKMASALNAKIALIEEQL